MNPLKILTKKKKNEIKNSNQNDVVLMFSKRFLKSKGKFFPNVGVSMSMLAIAISIAILIIVTSVMNGFREELLSKILGFNAHITVSKHEEFKNFNELKDEISKIKGVKTVNANIDGSGMIMRNSHSAGAFIKGISAEDLKNRKDLAGFVKADLDDFKGYKVILGRDLAYQLRLKSGDRVNIVVPIVSMTLFGAIPRTVSVKVIGLLKTNASQYDSYAILMPFDTAQVVFNHKKSASSLEIMTDNPEKIEPIEAEIFKKYYNQNVRIYDWKLENAPLLNALKVEANVMSLLLSLFTILSMFTIFAIIKMMVRTKEREIAILKSHGISMHQIQRIFFIVGATIATTGMVLGNIIGIAFAKNIDNIRLFLEKLLGTKLLDGSVYLLANLPSKLMVVDIIKINIFAIIMALICTILSTRKSSQLDITNTLRNN